jgi:hypothetical protein
MDDERPPPLDYAPPRRNPADFLGLSPLDWMVTAIVAGLLFFLLGLFAQVSVS